MRHAAARLLTFWSPGAKTLPPGCAAAASAGCQPQRRVRPCQLEEQVWLVSSPAPVTRLLVAGSASLQFSLVSRSQTVAFPRCGQQEGFHRWKACTCARYSPPPVQWRGVVWAGRQAAATKDRARGGNNSQKFGPAEDPEEH